jgi:hypothetical protein
MATQTVVVRRLAFTFQAVGELLCFGRAIGPDHRLPVQAFDVVTRARAGAPRRHDQFLEFGQRALRETIEIGLDFASPRYQFRVGRRGARKDRKRRP